MRKLNKPVKGLARRKDPPGDGYAYLLTAVVGLVESSRVASVRAVNTVLTSTYWLVGQRIVEHEQSGAVRAEYGQELMKRLATDLTTRLGRGFSERNLELMRLFYLEWRNPQTVSAESAAPGISQTPSAKLLPQFALPWSHYVRLMTVADLEARRYYEHEALRSGWSVRQLDRQIATVAYERRGRANAVQAIKDERNNADAEIRDPFVLEFLNLKDEHSETELENALIESLEEFLLELGSDFAFVARQKRLRVGTEWYRVDLLFFHQQLRCLVIVDLLCGRPHNGVRQHICGWVYAVAPARAHPSRSCNSTPNRCSGPEQTHRRSSCCCDGSPRWTAAMYECTNPASLDSKSLTDAVD